jgi:FkbM family methyltransferase
MNFLNYVAQFLNFFFKYFNAEVIKKTNLEKLRRDQEFKNDMFFLQAMPQPDVSECLSWLSYSRSQLRQDLFVLSVTGFKQNGIFLEIGAGDGFYLSNTFLLEDRFKWSGILAEPARTFHDSLSNRAATIEKRAIYSETGSTLEFLEAKSPELSTIFSFKDSDFHSRDRKAKKYKIKTLSLIHLIEQNNLPFHIDYLSIDTEGSEFEILKDFDFSKHEFKVITIEHNYDSEKREKIYFLLSRWGYKRVYTDISKFDDWYILKKDDLA